MSRSRLCKHERRTSCIELERLFLFCSFIGEVLISVNPYHRMNIYEGYERSPRRVIVFDFVTRFDFKLSSCFREGGEHVQGPPGVRATAAHLHARRGHVPRVCSHLCHRALGVAMANLPHAAGVRWIG